CGAAQQGSGNRDPQNVAEFHYRPISLLWRFPTAPDSLPGALLLGRQFLTRRSRLPEPYMANASTDKQKHDVSVKQRTNPPNILFHLTFQWPRRYAPAAP